MNIKPEINDQVMLDSWRVSETLLDSEWDKAQFYLTMPRTRMKRAVNITVTGRTFQKPNGKYGPEAVRIKIEFVGDGEPSTFAGGWLIKRANHFTNGDLGYIKLG